MHVHMCTHTHTHSHVHGQPYIQSKQKETNLYLKPHFSHFMGKYSLKVQIATNFDMHSTFISHPQICSVFPLSITNCVQVSNTSTVLFFFFTWLPHAQPVVKFWLTPKSQVIPYVLLSLVCPSLSGPSISSSFIPHNP